MAWPAAGFFTGFATQGQLRQALDDLLRQSRSQIGADGIANVTLNSSGAATGQSNGTLKIYGYASSADDMQSLEPSAYSDGQTVELRLGDVNQPITIKHQTSPGTGQFSVSGGVDLALNAVEQSVEFRRSGSAWYERVRSGREKVHLVGGSGEPAFAGSWTNGSPSVGFWRDGSGVVQIVGGAFISSLSATVSTIFTLPVGYRPAGTMIFPVFATVGTTDEIDCISVQASGIVAWDRVSLTVPSAQAVQLDLSPVSFRAAA